MMTTRMTIVTVGEDDDDDDIDVEERWLRRGDEDGDG